MPVQNITLCELSILLEHCIKIWIFTFCKIFTIRLKFRKYHFTGLIFFLRFSDYNQHICGQILYQFHRLIRTVTGQNWQFNLLKNFKKRVRFRRTFKQNLIWTFFKLGFLFLVCASVHLIYGLVLTTCIGIFHAYYEVLKYTFQFDIFFLDSWERFLM